MEHNTERNRELDAMLGFFIVIGLCGWRIWRTIMLHDLEYAKEVLYPTPFEILLLYIFLYSISFLFFEKRNHTVFINSSMDDKTFNYYMVARGLLMLVFGGGIFQELFQILIQRFDFSLLWYGTALMLTILLMLSLQRIVDYIPDPPKNSRT